MRISMLTELQAAFADQVSRQGPVSYVKAVLKVCSNNVLIDTWLEQHITLSSPIIRGAHQSRYQSFDEGDGVHEFNRLREVTAPTDELANYQHWEALRSLLQALPGVTFSELLQIVHERGVVPVVEQPKTPWVEFDALAIISQALDDSQSIRMCGSGDCSINPSSDDDTMQGSFRGWLALESIEGASWPDEIDATVETNEDDVTYDDAPSESWADELQESLAEEAESDAILDSTQHFVTQSQRPLVEELPEIEMELGDEGGDSPERLEDIVSARPASVNIESSASLTSEEILAASYFLQRTTEQPRSRDDLGRSNTVPETPSGDRGKRQKRSFVEEITPQTSHDLEGSSETESTKKRGSRSNKLRSEAGSENKGTRASSKQSALDPERARLFELYKKRQDAGESIFEGDEMD
jgi:hypothetical protein